MLGLPTHHRRFRYRLASVVTPLVGMNVIAWLAAYGLFHRQPILLGAAFLAYTMGLRHAVDADHIAAIDNVTRKLVSEGKAPLTIGLMFSLGHSSIVVAGALAIASGAIVLQHHDGRFREIASVIGTMVSISFLFWIALANLRTLKRAIRSLRRNGGLADLASIAAPQGMLWRIIGRAVASVGTNWQMYLLGALFGLGFDTATEIGILSLSASAASRGVAMREMILFPLLFAAGMSLVDSLDNILMLGAYGWAQDRPDRHLRYNLIVTVVSALVAVVVGTIESLNLLAEHSELAGSFWTGIRALNANFTLIGYGIIGMFLMLWLIFSSLQRIRKPVE